MVTCTFIEMRLFVEIDRVSRSLTAHPSQNCEGGHLRRSQRLSLLQKGVVRSSVYRAIALKIITHTAATRNASFIALASFPIVSMRTMDNLLLKVVTIYSSRS